MMYRPCLFGITLVISLICGEAHSTPKESSITVPLEIDLRQLEQLLQSTVPNDLADLSRGRQVCIPAEWAEWDYPCVRNWKIYRCRGRTKITPDIRCDIVGSARRDGDIRLHGTKDKIVISMPVYARVSARNIGGIIKSETAEARATVTVEAQVRIDQDWEPIFDIDLTLNWDKKPTLMLLDLIPITITGKVEPMVKRHLEGLERDMERYLAGFNIRRVVEDTWNTLHRPLTVSDNPRVTLFFSPRSAELSGIDIADNVARIDLTLSGTTAAYVGDDAPEPTISPLPELSISEYDGDGRFYVRVPVYLGRTGIGDQGVVRFLSRLKWRIDVEERLLVAELPFGDDRFSASLTYDYSDHIEAAARDRVVALGEKGVVVANVQDVIVENALSLDEQGLKIELTIVGIVRVDLASDGSQAPW